MLFNVNKCLVIHLGSRNRTVGYEFWGQMLNQSEQERDLGVIMHKSGKSTKECAAAKRANRTLGMTKRTVVSKSKSITLKLYKELVIPHLEYCIQVWNPHLQKDIERMQRRATRMIKGLGKLSYEDRLRSCKSTSPEISRIQVSRNPGSRGDLIETFKILTGREDLSPEHFFEATKSCSTKGHECKLYRKAALLWRIITSACE